MENQNKEKEEKITLEKAIRENKEERDSAKHYERSKDKQDERLTEKEALLYQEYASKLEDKKFSEQASEKAYEEAEKFLEKLKDARPDGKKEVEAEHEVIQDYDDEFELLLFQRIFESAKKDKNIPKGKTEELEEAFVEYMEVRQKLFTEHGGDFSQKMIYEKIPNNEWVKLMSGVFGFLRGELGLPDTAEEFIEQNPVSSKEKASFEKDVIKKKKGLDQN